MSKKIESGLTALGAEHDRVYANLPWFVNQTLDGDELQEATAHLSCCLVCRRELVALNALREAVTTRTAEPRCEAALDRLHERMNERVFMRRIVPWAAAAVLVLVLGLTGVVAFNAGVMSTSGEIAASIPVGATAATVVDDAVASVPVVPDQDSPTLPYGENLMVDDADELKSENANGGLVAAPPVHGKYNFMPLWQIRKAGLQSTVATSREPRQVIFFEPSLSIDASGQKE